MSPRPRFHLKTYVFIVLMILFGAFGDIFLSKGMKEIGRVSVSSASLIFGTFMRTFSSRVIWMGIGSLLLFFICYLVVLSWADYSFVSPASASSYGVVALLAWVVLGEVVTSVRWVGVLVICLGVLLVGHTPPNTTTERGGAD